MNELLQSQTNRITRGAALSRDGSLALAHLPSFDWSRPNARRAFWVVSREGEEILVPTNGMRIPASASSGSPVSLFFTATPETLLLIVRRGSGTISTLLLDDSLGPSGLGMDRAGNWLPQRLAVQSQPFRVG